MKLSNIPFETTDWAIIEPTRHEGEHISPYGVPAQWMTFVSGWSSTRLGIWRITGAKRDTFCCV